MGKKIRIVELLFKVPEFDDGEGIDEGRVDFVPAGDSL